MSSCTGPAIIAVEYGESVDLELSYQNEDGTAIDLTSSVPSVFSSFPSIIKDAAQFTITDAVNGKARFFLDRNDALQLRRGRNNRFRLQMIFGSQSDDVTPDIYIQVA